MKSPPVNIRTKRIEKLLEELEQLRSEYISERKNQQISALSPRRQELVNTIIDHKEVSFDFLARNFRAVPVSTLHYDLLHLMKMGFIQKMGSTRGAVYTAKVEGALL